MQYVYYFKGYYDEILYVGKTSDIFRRMKQHFWGGHLPDECYQNTREVYFAETGMSKYDNEVIETLLINQFKPIYNTEKVFMEQSDRAKYKLPELEWKPIYINQMEENGVSLNPFPYPFSNNKLSETQKQIAFIDYNIHIIIHKQGLLNKYYPVMREAAAWEIFKLIKTYRTIKENLDYSFYDLDMPITPQNIKYCYVTFEQPKSLELEPYFSLLEKAGLIEKTDTPNLYYAYPIVET